MKTKSMHSIVMTLVISASICVGVAASESRKITGITHQQDIEPILIISSNEPNQKELILVKQAELFYKKRYYSKALSRAEDVLKLNKRNREALQLKIQSQNKLNDNRDGEQLLEQANQYFATSQFGAAIMLYERYVNQHPDEEASIQPLITKSYYNLGVIALRKGQCDLSADYFRQNLLLSTNDDKSKAGLAIAKRCSESVTLELER